MRKLTVGIPTYDDFDGLYFTLQSIRFHHQEVMDDIEFVIIDNNPSSDHGKCVRNLTNWIKEPFQYLPFTKHQSTTIKNKIFDLSDTPYTICMDSHVLLEAGCLKKLIEYYESGEDNGNLLHGPLIYDDLKGVSTHFDLEWSNYMWGKWGCDDRGLDKDGKPFEIPAQGCGLFTCRTDSWLGFNQEFRGFGGEEGYIHEKYRKNGKKVMCLPFLRWLHRFQRVSPPNYPNDLKQRYLNYKIGFEELGLSTKELDEHFKNILEA